MSEARAAGVVVDTMVISWLFDDRANPLADTSARRRLLAPRARRQAPLGPPHPSAPQLEDPLDEWLAARPAAKLGARNRVEIAMWAYERVA